ncbi:choice-of-anchor E domain-containing protein [Sphingomonas piscis]|uniref:Choice-of-anchor E domain-containing protein n=1 Tax=Sphingomonas piscis TaxID=2714943 RepID=A0A6G7YPY1_9SPHN|nr:choice-of-anchor E domain-containing protein [Sphingomonas piscis]QIK78793.1 choice-of-anchor E domain-containing protein [Sphingomonas piscis]
MKLKMLSAAVALACAAPVHAQVLSQTVTSDITGVANQFSGFDSALGSLNSVRFTGTISDHRFLEIFSPKGHSGARASR